MSVVRRGVSRHSRRTRTGIIQTRTRLVKGGQGLIQPSLWQAAGPPLTFSRFRWMEPPIVFADRSQIFQSVPTPRVSGTPTTVASGDWVIQHIDGANAGEYEAILNADFIYQYEAAESSSFSKKT